METLLIIGLVLLLVIFLARTLFKNRPKRADSNAHASSGLWFSSGARTEHKPDKDMGDWGGFDGGGGE